MKEPVGTVFATERTTNFFALSGLFDFAGTSLFCTFYHHFMGCRRQKR
jgi:hypothetical protein